MSYLGENIPKLGFGLMRLPHKDRQIDMAQTMEMVDYFLDSGFTYFDTAYVYYNGKSEEIAKAAIVDRYPRDRFQLATKLPAWDAETGDEARQMFWTSLERTGAGYFDYYLLHNVGSPHTKRFDDFGLWDYALGLKEKGLVRNLGFSFHDKAEALEEVLVKHPEMDFVQLQINYADWESGSIQSRKCYEVASKHNIPIIVMEPVKGGMLGDLLAPEVKAVFEESGVAASYASWALRFAASIDGLITVLSGMSNMDQLRENVSLIKDFRPLCDKEYAVIEKARKALEAMPSVPCTACGYCTSGCPAGISIPDIFEKMNRELVYNNPNGAKDGYLWEIEFGGKASDCTECGKCEQVCPQGLGIMDWLKDAARKYE